MLPCRFWENHSHYYIPVSVHICLPKLCLVFFFVKKWKLLNFGEKGPVINYAITLEPYIRLPYRSFLRAHQVGVVIWSSCTSILETNWPTLADTEYDNNNILVEIVLKTVHNHNATSDFHFDFFYILAWPMRSVEAIVRWFPTWFHFFLRFGVIYWWNRSHLNIVIPFRIAVPVWGQATWSLSALPPKRDCGPKRVDNIGTPEFKPHRGEI